MSVPYLLILLRFICAPVIVALAHFAGPNAKVWIVALMYFGLISDILDGIIARSTNISTEKMRRLDSQVDMIFWFSLGLATWILYPKLIQAHQVPIYVILAMEAACYAISIIRFNKETCTHAFLSKLWGISLLIGFTSLIGFNHAGIPFKLAIVMGLISHIDRILITLILPKWTHDVPSAYHAYLIRKKIPFKRNRLLNG